MNAKDMVLDVLTNNGKTIDDIESSYTQIIIHYDEDANKHTYKQYMLYKFDINAHRDRFLEELSGYYYPNTHDDLDKIIILLKGNSRVELCYMYTDVGGFAGIKCVYYDCNDDNLLGK
jgi:hypothetical protein